MADWRTHCKHLPLVGPLLESAWRRLTGRRDLAFTLQRSPLLHFDATIVKIGANDGHAGDPIAQLLLNRPAMRCVFVEPVQHLLDRARARWGDAPRFTYVNAAINDGQPAIFHYLDPQARVALTDLSFDPDQLGSFDRNHIIKHPRSERLLPYLRTQPVCGLTLADLFTRANVTKLDLLHIDTEGWDWKILSQLDLTYWQPSFIVFEHIHLAAEEKSAARARLSSRYDLETYGTDWLCTRRTHSD